jgi:hypothetical protein
VVNQLQTSHKYEYSTILQLILKAQVCNKFCQSFLSGVGYFEVCILNIHNHFSIFEREATLLPSLASFIYHLKLKKAIVHKIASIVITIISSTRVNQSPPICLSGIPQGTLS